MAKRLESSNMSREKEIVGQSIEMIKKHLHPKKIWLFGSRAKGKAQKGSDFDFAVEAVKPEGKAQAALEEDLDKVAGLHHIDVVYWHELEQEFKKIVLRTGSVVYERS